MDIRAERAGVEQGGRSVWRRGRPLIASALVAACVAAAAALSAPPAAATVWPDVVNQVSEELGAAEVETRRSAARRLGQLPVSAAHRLLARALADPDPQVRVEGARVAIHTGYSQAASIVPPWLADSEVSLRRSAARVLAAFAAQNKANAALARGLNDPDPSVRLAVAQALGNNPTTEAVSALLGHLDDNDTQVVLAVIDALERSLDRQAAVALVGKLQDSNAQTRIAAARALGTLATEQAVTALCLVLQDSDPAVRRAAVQALGRTRSAVAIEPLAKLVDNDKESLELRNAALQALARFSAAPAVQRLIAARNPARPEVSVLAGQALLQMGPRCVQSPECRQALFECVGQESQPVRAEACAEALAHAHEPQVYDAVAQVFRRGGIGVQSAVRAYGELGDPRALPSLLQLLSHPDQQIRMLAIASTLEVLAAGEPDGRAVEPIVHALGVLDRSNEERARLIALLGATRTERAATGLLPLLGPQITVELRLAALRAAGRIGVTEPSLRQPLLAALGDLQPAVRFEAARALRRAGDGGLTRGLLRELQDGSARDPFALILALPGPLSRTSDPGALRDLSALLGRAVGKERDGLIEALAWLSGPGALAELQRQGTTDTASKAKAAEALAGLPRASSEAESVLQARAQVLEVLLSDPDVRVRSNAVWTAGLIAARTEGAAKRLLPKLKTLLGDADESVAANAAVAFGRTSRSLTPQRTAEVLCPLVNDSRPYVRANALTSLAAAKSSCARAAALDRLGHDRSRIVRARAARALGVLNSSAPDPATIQALDRCAQTDVSSAVALECEHSPAQLQAPNSDSAHWATIFVVPAGAVEPAPEAPFALALPSGWVRLGFADRRGAVFEASEQGALSLEVAAGGGE